MGLRSAKQLLPSELITVARAAPTTGATVLVTAATVDIVQVIDPAGTIATLTITLPTADHDGQKVNIASTQIVTALTLNSAAGTIVGAATSLAVGSFATYVWLSSQTKWYRCS
jgi:hypothetical protein